MQKKSVLISIFLIVVVLLVSCSNSNYLKSSTEKATVSTKNDIFDISVNELVNILNKEFEEENLQLITKNYTIAKQKNWVTYRYTINDRLMVRFVKSNANEEGLIRVGLSYLQEASYGNSIGGNNYRVSEDGQKEAIKYYEIICNNFSPRFNAKKFVTEHGNNFATLELDELLFYNCSSALSTEEGSEKISIYEVISSKKIYETYEEEIEDDEDLFFILNAD